MQKTILHIDFDSYFASCEQQFNPALRGKPIGVTATNGRTCIIAASREAKKFGVKSVTRVWEAQQICPQIITVPAHFEKYWEQTQKFLNICKDYSPYVELFSLDEVFMDVTKTNELFGGRFKIIERIRERIKNEIGEYITVSVGISYNKLLAKLGSGLNKPNGLVEITEENKDEIYKKVKLTDFCGIGQRVALRLNKIGIYTPIDLKLAPLDILIGEFKGVEGRFLKDLGQGEDNRDVIPYYTFEEAKSIGRSYCLPHNEYDKRIVFQNVYELCEELAIKLRKLNKKAKVVWIYLGGTKSLSGRKTLSYFESGREIFNACMSILYESNFVFLKNDYVRRIGLGVSGFEDNYNLPLSIFEKDLKNHRLLETVDRINEKHGSYTLRNAFLLYADKLKTVPNGYMADKYERLKLSKVSL
ncbi:MAG TPA: DNA polymerase IV [Candidatus Sulfotelmatobacter sp.]|nr:DNA polymerase IV [Candidatus Sulfotelmatobacter sp.]